MTEPQAAGADLKKQESFQTKAAVADGDHWIINGEKWFSSFASMASLSHSIVILAMTAIKSAYAP